ncbi:MAG: hypothetical protein U1E52_05820 [Geminicoccaceae bacterium]
MPDVPSEAGEGLPAIPTGLISIPSTTSGNVQPMTVFPAHRFNLASSAVLSACCLLAACAEFESASSLRQQGYSESYVAGYAAGCESGKKVGGSLIAREQRDPAAYQADPDYRGGWDKAFMACSEEERSLQEAFGGGTVPTPTQHSDHIDEKGLLQGIDTTPMKDAGW